MADRHRGMQAVYRVTADMRRDAGQPADTVPYRQPDGQLHRSRVCQPRPITVLILVVAVLTRVQVGNGRKLRAIQQLHRRPGLTAAADQERELPVSRLHACTSDSALRGLHAHDHVPQYLTFVTTDLAAHLRL